MKGARWETRSARSLTAPDEERETYAHGAVAYLAKLAHALVTALQASIAAKQFCR